MTELALQGAASLDFENLPGAHTAQLESNIAVPGVGPCPVGHTVPEWFLHAAPLFSGENVPCVHGTQWVSTVAEPSMAP